MVAQLASFRLSADLVPQTEVEAVQLDKGGGLNGGLLFELLLPALRWEAGPGHGVTQGAVGAARKAALQVDGVSCHLWGHHWYRWSGRLLCWQDRRQKIRCCEQTGAQKPQQSCNSLPGWHRYNYSFNLSSLVHGSCNWATQVQQNIQRGFLSQCGNSSKSFTET